MGNPGNSNVWFDTVDHSPTSNNLLFSSFMRKKVLFTAPLVTKHVSSILGDRRHDFACHCPAPPLSPAKHQPAFPVQQVDRSPCLDRVVCRPTLCHAASGTSNQPSRALGACAAR
ncbi:hypothetical protein LY76DRAFT_195821 [Colletotrichum caudatum]|nr:hypothetical protein LY76DRAFT_195821 [Colletotrichum caudatum]